MELDGESKQQVALQIQAPFLTAYRQRLQNAAPVVRIAQSISGKAEEQLIDCFVSVNWAIIQDSATELNEYVMVECVVESVPTKTICVSPNQKQMNQDVCCGPGVGH